MYQSIFSIYTYRKIFLQYYSLLFNHHNKDKFVPYNYAYSLEHAYMLVIFRYSAGTDKAEVFHLLDRQSLFTPGGIFRKARRILPLLFCFLFMSAVILSEHFCGLSRSFPPNERLHSVGKGERNNSCKVGRAVLNWFCSRIPCKIQINSAVQVSLR